jgi:hypothetical protein
LIRRRLASPNVPAGGIWEKQGSSFRVFSVLDVAKFLVIMVCVILLCLIFASQTTVLVWLLFHFPRKCLQAEGKE